MGVEFGPTAPVLPSPIFKSAQADHVGLLEPSWLPSDLLRQILAVVFVRVGGRVYIRPTVSFRFAYRRHRYKYSLTKYDKRTGPSGRTSDLPRPSFDG